MLSIPRSPRQQGQALPLTLIFLLVLCVGLMVTFNTGQVVNKKVELTNAADAAAYSVAVEQARAWNLAAYMNRGRIANEVAVAQLVSLNSWMTQINVSAKMTETYSNILSAVPYVGFIFKAVAQIAKAADQIMRPIRTGLREASGPAIGLIDQVLNQSYAQVAELAIEQASTAGAMKVAHDVVDANSPNAKVTALSYANLVRQMEQARSEYLQQFNVPKGRSSGSVGGDRYRNLVMESRDKFTVDRRDDAKLFIIGFEANGGTDMVDYNRWSAVDTNNFVVDIWLLELDLPLGWAGAQAAPNRNKRFFAGMGNGRGWYSDYQRKRLKAYNGLSPWEMTSQMAESDPGGSMVGGKRNHAFFTQYKNGIAHQYHDVKDGKARTPEDGPIFTVEVATSTKETRTSSNIGMATGRMDVTESPPGDKIKALSSAQIYFNRPHDYNGGRMFNRYVRGRSDARYEAGSLFSPYWQARLTETPATLRASFNALSAAP
ncbi:pilus assembly protein TadG-related protein [Solilutibacter tolerans]|uniref:Putative Flp pilus-assembly TadE/G-like n=1 Tax=Solilutibacter tolerans TaxID=1604334 RepID=A0A1N6RJ74_9GAMM|nr:pilus assembly protein TadG-related protein [Lysobacter tolerans]SIQ28849.1 Putative Flp pilus-assembly TadE/G-like [Lysobacter tolerans]